MRISAKLAHRVLDQIAEALGAMDIALRADDKEENNRRIVQSQNALRKAARLISGQHLPTGTQE